MIVEAEYRMRAGVGEVSKESTTSFGRNDLEIVNSEGSSRKLTLSLLISKKTMRTTR